jgi:hypothetical protein
MRKHLVGLAVVLAGISAAGVASASEVCDLFYLPSSSTLGSYGYIYFTLFTGANCSGSFVGEYWLCSSNATSQVCASTSSYSFTSDGELMGMSNQLLQAIIYNVPTTVNTATCNGGGSGCATTVGFHNN